MYLVVVRVIYLIYRLLHAIDFLIGANKSMILIELIIRCCLLIVSKKQSKIKGEVPYSIYKGDNKKSRKRGCRHNSRQKMLHGYFIRWIVFSRRTIQTFLQAILRFCLTIYRKNWSLPPCVHIRVTFIIKKQEFHEITYISINTFKIVFLSWP